LSTSESGREGRVKLTLMNGDVTSYSITENDLVLLIVEMIVTNSTRDVRILESGGGSRETRLYERGREGKEGRKEGRVSSNEQQREWEMETNETRPFLPKLFKHRC